MLANITHFNCNNCYDEQRPKGNSYPNLPTTALRNKCTPLSLSLSLSLFEKTNGVQQLKTTAMKAHQSIQIHVINLYSIKL